MDDSTGTPIAATEEERRRILNRLRRLEGQIRGLQTMVESGYVFERGGPTYTLKETAVFSPAYLLESSISWFDNSFERTPTLHPDTNQNGVMFIDDRPELGGNLDGFFQARERDPGEDYDRDRAFDLYEDFNLNGRLDYNEDRDEDGRLTPPMGCEGDSTPRIAEGMSRRTRSFSP